MIKPIGFSIFKYVTGFEPVIVFSDMSFKYIYPVLTPMSSADARKEGLRLGKMHHLPFRIRLNMFKEIINA